MPVTTSTEMIAARVISIGLAVFFVITQSEVRRPGTLHLSVGTR